MTQEASPKKRLFILPISVFCWTSAFLIALGSHNWFNLSEKPGLFSAASLLTVLSIFVVYGFSSLRQHRNAYLLLGLLGAILTFYMAEPLVSRSRTIDNIGKISAGTLKLTVASNAPIQADHCITELKSSLYSELTREAKGIIPEKHLQILLLCLSQLLLASGLGLWIGEGIDDSAHLIPVALVATLADIWSVSAGATAKIIVSPVINYFLLRFPMPGHNAVPFLIGLTDFLFFGIFFHAATKFQLGTLKNAILLTLSFFIAFTAAIFFETGLPVLPFMAAIFVCGNFSRLKLKREEIKQIILFIMFIAAAFLIISKLMH